MKIRLDQLTSFEIIQLFKNKSKNKIGLILPVGCIEQHGPFLPLGCDIDISRKVSETLALKLEKINNYYKAFVMPDFSYTPSPGAENIAGTISVSFDFLGNGLKEIIKSAIKTNWDFIIIINSHAHNHGRIIEASIAGSSGFFGKKVPIVVINLYEFSNLINKLGNNAGSHAGELEISIYKYYYKDYKFPELSIKKNKLKERPNKIYGLEILKRSYKGIISENIPDIKNAISKSNEIGQLLDNEVFNSFINNLNIYFKNWN